MRRRKLNTNKLIGLLFFSLLLAFAICFFLKSDYFNLDEVQINDNSYLSKGDIKKLLGINNGRNIFSYDLKALKKNICSSSYIKDCDIKRKLPNKIIVTVEEKKLIGPLYNGDTYCLVDGEGNYVDRLKDNKNRNMVISIDYTLVNKNIKFSKLKDKDYLIVLLKSLEENNILKQIDYVDFTKQKTIEMKMKKGLSIVVNKEDDINNDVDKLNKILIDLQNRKVSTGIVDMTYNNYILYKP